MKQYDKKQIDQFSVADKHYQSFKQNNQQGRIMHASMHVKAVFDCIQRIQDTMEQYKQEKDNYKTLIEEGKTKENKEYVKVQENLHGVFEEIQKNFKDQVEQQKFENDKLREIVVNLKKEKTDLQQLIIQCARKCQRLEQELGTYPIKQFLIKIISFNYIQIQLKNGIIQDQQMNPRLSLFLNRMKSIEKEQDSLREVFQQNRVKFNLAQNQWSILNKEQLKNKKNKTKNFNAKKRWQKLKITLRFTYLIRQ